MAGTKAHEAGSGWGRELAATMGGGSAVTITVHMCFALTQRPILPWRGRQLFSHMNSRLQIIARVTWRGGLSLLGYQVKS